MLDFRYWILIVVANCPAGIYINRNRIRCRYCCPLGHFVLFGKSVSPPGNVWWGGFFSIDMYARWARRFVSWRWAVQLLRYSITPLFSTGAHEERRRALRWPCAVLRLPYPVCREPLIPLSSVNCKLGGCVFFITFVSQEYYCARTVWKKPI